MLWVFIGGGIGSIARFALSWVIPPVAGFPVSTLMVNLSGSLMLGFLYGLLHNNYHSALYALLAIGLCGGFTTFSTFSVETLRMVEAGKILYAWIYVLVSVLGGVLVAYGGFLTTRWLV